MATESSDGTETLESPTIESQRDARDKGQDHTATSDAGGKVSGKVSRTWKSRAVLRVVQPGSWVTCFSCAEQIKYQVRAQNMQMICNVYEDGVWNRVEHFHADCYDDSGQPYGPADD